MKRWATSSFAAAVLVLLLSEPAHANEPPAPQTMLAQILIVPIALAFFAFSGAAALYDRKKAESLKRAGKVKKRSPRRGRLRTLGIATLACLLSGMHEGFAVLLSLVLCGYAILLAVRMVRASRGAPPGNYPRRATLVAGVILIPLAVFLASFSLMFFSGNDVYRYQHHSDRRLLHDFWEYQAAHAKEHDGVYLRLSSEGADADGDTRGEYLLDRLKAGLSSTRLWVRYPDNLRGYAIGTTPAGSLPWPYRWFTSYKSFYMDQTGVIRYVELSSPGEGATAESPLLERLQ